MRILYLGSGPFGLPTLERLAACGVDLVVGTVPDAPRGRKRQPEPTVIKARALELGVPVHETDSLKGRRGPAFLDETGGELVITCDFRLILGRRFLETPARGCFNLHGSILPAHRGAAPVARGVLAGDETFGISLYRMVLALDAGPVVDALRYVPEAPMTTEALEAALAPRAADLLERWLPRLIEGDVPAVPQDDAAATYAPKLEKHEGWIDWQRRAAEIERQVRGLHPWPRAFTHFGDPAEGSDAATRIFIDRAEVAVEGGSESRGAEPVAAESPESVPPGTVRRADASGIAIACGPAGRETLRALELQRAGKRSLAAEDFLRGFPLERGRFLAPPRAEDR